MFGILWKTLRIDGTVSSLENSFDVTNPFLWLPLHQPDNFAGDSFRILVRFILSSVADYWWTGSIISRFVSMLRSIHHSWVKFGLTNVKHVRDATHAQWNGLSKSDLIHIHIIHSFCQWRCDAANKQMITSSWMSVKKKKENISVLRIRRWLAYWTISGGRLRWSRGVISQTRHVQRVRRLKCHVSTHGCCRLPGTGHPQAAEQSTM